MTRRLSFYRAKRSLYSILIYMGTYFASLVSALIENRSEAIHYTNALQRSVPCFTIGPTTVRVLFDFSLARSVPRNITILLILLESTGTT